MAHTYDVGTRAWQPDPTEGWIASEVQQKKVDGDRVKLIFALANGEVCYTPCTVVSTCLADNSPVTDENRRDYTYNPAR